jgi:hypothetical protein
MHAPYSVHSKSSGSWLHCCALHASTLYGRLDTPSSRLLTSMHPVLHVASSCAPPPQRTICFRNAKDGGFMRTFTGRWEVSPFCQVGAGRECRNHAHAKGAPTDLVDWAPRRLGGVQHQLDNHTNDRLLLGTLLGRRALHHTSLRPLDAGCGCWVAPPPYFPLVCPPPLQDTLNRIYSPHDTQRHRGVHLGWLNPARALGAMQHREFSLVWPKTPG